MKRIAKGGDEVDVFSRWRRVYTCCARAGYCKRIKQQANRRERREVRQRVKNDPENV